MESVCSRQETQASGAVTLCVTLDEAPRKRGRPVNHPKQIENASSVSLSEISQKNCLSVTSNLSKSTEEDILGDGEKVELDFIAEKFQIRKRSRPRRSRNDAVLSANQNRAEEKVLIKKRGRPRKYFAGSRNDAMLSANQNRPAESFQIKKRGRPRKTFVGSRNDAVLSANQNRAAEKFQNKKRGRPRKYFVESRIDAVLSANQNRAAQKFQIKRRGRPRKYFVGSRNDAVLSAKQNRAAENLQIKKRGRPRKYFVESRIDAVLSANQNRAAENFEIKKRGRPRKCFVESRTDANQNRAAEEFADGGEVDEEELHKGRAADALRGKRRFKSKLPPPLSPNSLTSDKRDAMRHPIHDEHAIQADKDAPFMDAVVKVLCVHTEPNFSLPWQRKHQFSSTSSGFIIRGRRVLTNAHSVEHHTQVKVKKRGSDTKYLATVLAVGTECDVAMLSVSGDEFWEGVIPVEFGALPRLQDAVTVVGYPVGGDTISVTSGVVSRIEVTSYVHGSIELLGVQIDAAINLGNSGGPAFNEKGLCVGIAFQSLKHEDIENIGFIIPTPVINHFILDYGHSGDYTGFPILGVEWQKMENPDLRKAVGMKASQKGVRIRRVEPTAPAAKFLQSSDIIMSFDGIDIANDGTVPFRLGERIGFSYLVSQKFTGEQARIKLLRNGNLEEYDINLATHKRLVPVHIKGKPPSYYIVAGIVFMAVSVPYLRSEYGKDYNSDAPVKLLGKLLYSMAQTEDEQLVVVSQVLVADINIGYEEIVNTQVLAFNNTRIRNLKHLVTMVECCRDEFLRFELEYEQVVILQTKAAKAATLRILRTHCIPSASSNDLKS